MNITLNAQVESIEPPNWWTGMKNQNLQLMVHGKNISGSVLSIDYPGVVVKNITFPENQNYIFIDLEIASSTKPGIINLKFSKSGKTQKVDYELKAREKGSSARKGFDNSDVIYLIVPDRFANGNGKNDSVSGLYEGLNRRRINGRHGGDIKGVSDHVDYLKNMGFTALWSTPMLENNQKRTSYHGYAITDFYKIDPRMGNNDEYIELSKRLKENGIKLIMDMIFNHCGSEHPWMKDMPFPDWINNYPEIKITSHRRTTNSDPHASEYDKLQMSDGWFVQSMPDLNQRNPFMANYLIQNSIWWIETAGLAGIRMDTYPYPDKFMMADWTNRVLEEYPNFTMVGEEWSYNPAIVSYWQRGQNNRDKYVSNLPSLMDFPVQQALVQALNEPEQWDKGWVKLYETLALDFLYPEPSNLVVIGDNHDMARFFMQLDKNVDLYKMGIAFLLTTRGTPQIYYGSEILMTHPKSNEHGDIRKDFPGGWANDSVNAFTGIGLTNEQIRMQNYFKLLLNWRKNTPAIHTGKLVHFAPENGCYVYFRFDDSKTIMVILNKNLTNTSLNTEKYKERIKNFSIGKDVETGKTFELRGEISIPAKTALILELE